VLVRPARANTVRFKEEAKMKKDMKVYGADISGLAGQASAYDDAKVKLWKHIDEVPLNLETIERDILVGAATDHPKAKRFENQSIERRCVNYLRHNASGYDGIIRSLESPDSLGLTGVARHVLHVERRACVARVSRVAATEAGYSLGCPDGEAALPAHERCAPRAADLGGSVKEVVCLEGLIG
jgi:hypothetical protein